MKTKAVTEAVNELWAILATAAAKNAWDAARIDKDFGEAEKWAAATQGWLERAGARATRWRFRQP